MRLKKIIEAKPDNIDLDGYDRISPGFRKTILKSVAKEVKYLKKRRGPWTSDDAVLRSAWRNVSKDLRAAWRKLLKQERERWEELGKHLDRWDEQLGGVKRYYPVKPNYCASPGEILQDALEQRGISQARAARMIGISVYELRKILEGETPLSDEIAESLERTLGVPASLWKNAEINYRSFLQSGDKEND